MKLSAGGPILVVGAGKMGGAIVEGWLDLGVDPASIFALDPKINDENAAPLRRAGVRINPDRAALPTPSVVLLAIKPQMMAEALAPLARHFGPDTLVVSIMAGKTIAGIAALLPAGAAIVRAMPNTPAAIGRGITVAVPNGAVTPAQRQTADTLLMGTGGVEWVSDESLIDAVTAVSGSGPAYVFHLVEALASAGVAAGLDEALAMRLARATVEGSGELLHRSPGVTAAKLRENVTSPAGTTAAALSVLMGKDGLPALMTRAVAAAKARAQELAG
jgi:pyrroline-5-carboxylate reductase